MKSSSRLFDILSDKSSIAEYKIDLFWWYVRRCGRPDLAGKASLPCTALRACRTADSTTHQESRCRETSASWWLAWRRRY